MAQNLECKIRVALFTNYKQTLSKIGAEYKGTLNQKDVYYTYPNGLLKLRIEDDSFQLIKYNRNGGDGDRFCKYDILFITGPDIEKYFGEILKQEAAVEKKRELYLYKGSRIHLDTVKELGNFIEIETIVTDGEEDAKTRFDEIVHHLKLDLDEQIKASYRNLIDRFTQ